jgi:hypothetical protein
MHLGRLIFILSLLGGEISRWITLNFKIITLFIAVGLMLWILF